MRKFLMIGLDGATFYLLDHLISEGVMPFLKDFMEKGVKADLMSTRNPLTPPAWTSMVTGRSPHAHGVYDFLRPATTADNSIFLQVNDSRHNRCETVWSMLARQGKRATSLNFYGMSPPPKIDGYLISGFVPWRYLRQATHPESLFETIKTLPDFDYKNLGMDIGEEKKCVQGLLEGEHHDWIQLQDDRDTAWTELCCHLMKTDPTELTAIVLDGPDKLQHLFWRFVDPVFAESDPNEWWLDVRDHCLNYYRQVDRNIQKMVEAAGPDTNVIMTSDHGFGPTDEIVYINEWLSREGYLQWADVAEEDATGQLTANKIKDHLQMIDWKNTSAYCPTPSSNAIYLKKANGSGNGVPPSEYLDYCLKLKQALLDYRDPRTGGQVFARVDLNKLEGTAYVEPSPDITVSLRDGGFVSILKSTDVVSPRKHVDGTHRPNGIFLASGPDFKVAEQLEALDLLDITPLMLHLLGLPVPGDLEGAVPIQALADSGEARQVTAAAATVAPQGRNESNRPEPSDEEREALLKQMQLLGYMD